VDSFAGGGGASTGITWAIGRSPDFAINHDPEAVAMHAANHPDTVHLCQNVWKADPRDVVGKRKVGLAWFSPDCKHFSKAKGGRPVKRNIRDLAWVVVHWAKLVRPRIICLENVEEFQDWGPLLEDGRPCPVQRGLTFRRWVRGLRQLGYAVEWRELRACDYGAPTIRKRLFLVARCDGQPIVWPSPTHGPGRLPYRTAAECIDWSIPCPSIFERKRPLAEATMRRIARGIQRYVIDAAEPFIVPVTHAGDSRVHSVNDPLRTMTCAPRGEHALVTPYVVGLAHGTHVERPGARSHDVNQPVRTIHAGGGNHALVAPYLIPRYGERPGQDPRCQSVEAPISTIVPTANGAQLVAAFMAQHNGGMVGHRADKPVSTIVQRGTTQALVTSNLVKLKGTCRDGQAVDRPLPTVQAGGWHIGEVRAFLVKYFETATGQSLREPLHTVTSRDRFGLVTVQGQEYQIVDIGMRMLTARELFRAQGFDDAYIIDPIHNGAPLTKTAQIRMCGNSVCPQVARAVVAANLGIEQPSYGVAAQ
jgi:DNA (cytosine-5)-methyltransferase 1